MGFAIILQILVGYGMKVYRGLYSYGSFGEVWRAGATVGIVSVALFLFSYVDEALGLIGTCTSWCAAYFGGYYIAIHGGDAHG